MGGTSEEVEEEEEEGVNGDEEELMEGKEDGEKPEVKDGIRVVDSYDLGGEGGGCEDEEEADGGEGVDLFSQASEADVEMLSHLLRVKVEQSELGGREDQTQTELGLEESVMSEITYMLPTSAEDAGLDRGEGPSEGGAHGAALVWSGTLMRKPKAGLR